VEENVFWFGTVIASKLKTEEGIVESFKLTNCKKIPCTVKIQLKPGNDGKSEGFVFSASHKEPLRIYPHESEYVKITLKPTDVMPYSAIFEDLVE
jgi:hypothetical protein